MSTQVMAANGSNSGNMVYVLNNLINELLNNIEGQLVDKGRVEDHLLDLRLAANGNERATAAIDGLLGAVPGKSVVETSWWRDALTGLADAAAPAAV